MLYKHVESCPEELKVSTPVKNICLAFEQHVCSGNVAKRCTSSCWPTLIRNPSGHLILKYRWLVTYFFPRRRRDISTSAHTNCTCCSNRTFLKEFTQESPMWFRVSLVWWPSWDLVPSCCLQVRRMQGDRDTTCLGMLLWNMSSNVICEPFHQLHLWNAANESAYDFQCAQKEPLPQYLVTQRRRANGNGASGACGPFVYSVNIQWGWRCTHDCLHVYPGSEHLAKWVGTTTLTLMLLIHSPPLRLWEKVCVLMEVPRASLPGGLLGAQQVLRWKCFYWHQYFGSCIKGLEEQSEDQCEGRRIKKKKTWRELITLSRYDIFTTDAIPIFYLHYLFSGVTC